MKLSECKEHDWKLIHDWSLTLGKGLWRCKKCKKEYMGGLHLA